MRGPFQHLLLLALLASGTAALAEAPAEWHRSSSPNGVFSVETPCTPDEVAALKDYVPDHPPAPVAAIYADTQTRVVCIKDDSSFLVSTLLRPRLATESGSLFDFFVQQLSRQPGAPEPKVTKLSGRRATVNRQVSGELVGESGIVEVNAERVILYNLVSPVSQKEALRNFRQSIEALP